MLSPSRLLTLVALVVVAYAGFYAPPGNARGPDAFDPELVARYEASAWRAGFARDEWAAFSSAVKFQRELHRYSWFRAAQTGFTLSRVIVQFPNMTTARYDRVLPSLEELARVERAWREVSFEPQDVARKQLSWLTAARNPPRGSGGERVTSDMSEEYALRYGLRPDQTYDAVSGRSEAFRIMLTPRTDPDWDAIERLLGASYGVLKRTLERQTETTY